MPDSETSPITSPTPHAGAKPNDATITVTRAMDPPVIPPRSEPSFDQTARQTWRPMPNDATPRMSDPSADVDTAPTRFQDAGSVAIKRPGMPDIPGYEILAEIGRGGMGVVFKARQLDLNRTVAVKMIIGEGYERPEQLARFQLEAEMAARIRHPNVVQVYDSGKCGGRPYLVLEWVDGGTLSTYLKGKPQQPRVAARAVSLLARAVHATHCVGIVHRDLKPGNVLVATAAAAVTPSPAGVPTSTSARQDVLGVTLTVDGQPIAMTPKVTDFGLAKRIASDINLTETGRVLGTPEYMAPEQAAGKINDIGPATDVYALGIILYQMLAGQTPFRDSTIAAIMHRVIEEEPKPPRSYQPKLPRDLETICLKCLEKVPTRRYATADALAEDLDSFLEGRPITARPTGSIERVWKWAARRPGVAFATAAAALFFILGFAGVTWQWRATVAQRDRAVKAEGAAVTQRDRAVKAEAVTDAVNRFLVKDMLDTATPEKELGRKITVEEVLQNASARIDGTFANQPEVAAGVRVALGNSYRKLGLFPPAEKHLAAGLELRKKTLGDKHHDTLAAAADRGLLLADERNLKEAVPLMRQVVTDAKATLGSDDPLTIEASGRLALVLQENGDTPEAERLFRETLATARRVFGPADPRTLTILNDLGQLLMARKQLPEAEATFRQAAEGRAKALSATHPATLESKHNLAAVIDDEGRWAEAKPIYQQVLADKIKVLGRAHVDTLQSMNLLAALLERHGDLEAALVMNEDALAGFRDALGADNPLTLNAQSNLGQFVFRFGMRASRPDLRERAETILTAVLDARRRVLPPNHPDILLACNNLAVVLIAQRRLDDAEPLMKEALAGQRKVFGPGHPDTLRSVNNYSQFLRDRRKLAEGISECEDALDAAAKAKTTEHPQAVALLCTLVELLSAQSDRLNDALERANQALTLTSRIHGDSSGESIRARRNLGVVLLLLNQPVEAEPHLRAVYDASLKTFGANHTRTVRDAGKLGACLLAEKRYEDAEPLLIGCYQTVRDLRDVPKAQVRAYGEQVVKLYEAWGKLEKAAEWREKLK